MLLMMVALMAEEKSRHQDAVQVETVANETDPERPESPAAEPNRLETSREASVHTEPSGSQDATMLDAEISSKIQYVKQLFVDRTENYGIPQLERLYTRIMKGVFETKDKEKIEDDPKHSILKFLVKFAEDESNF